MTKHTIIDLIDKRLESDQEDGKRGHLGGSLIGRPCERELYYSFRWATSTVNSDEHTGDHIDGHHGRLLRLFNRGHLEEDRFNSWLRSIGIVVREFDITEHLIFGVKSGKLDVVSTDKLKKYNMDNWEDVTLNPFFWELAKKRGLEFKKPEQFRILDVDGHFGGSLDAIMTNVPGIEQFGLKPTDEVLGEFKTHGLKSFNKIAGTRPRYDQPREGAAGVKFAKPEHWAQMQTYMHKRGIKLALYMAICKDDDDLYFEWVEYDAMAGAAQIGKARDIIHADAIPVRMSDSPSDWRCKFCDHYQTCHMGAPLAKSCRTCISSKPIAEGQWHCSHWDSVIPLEHQKTGCANYQTITD